ncbi:hypothetical protein C0Q70_04266 [Pomacea canaliculata]|uniref:Ig-like domain-containing protein n=1 Tax=Pomacea canaliculata TaxID=400727 RepID=A0A2T7PV23_POMCA|nr:hypothetical protein C0Q70_04266 [Pomacea canaliculata]
MSVFWQRVPTTSTTFTTSTWTKAESDVRCEREASRPTYTWFKDGESLQHVSGDVEILSNTLTVVSPDALVINGMYQCRASKHPWPSYSTGQMRDSNPLSLNIRSSPITWVLVEEQQP